MKSTATDVAAPIAQAPPETQAGCDSHANCGMPAPFVPLCVLKRGTVLPVVPAC
jgi:hypothetical protein